MKKLSEATKRFLQKCEPDELGEAILSVDVKYVKDEDNEYSQNKSRFVIEIFERYVNEDNQAARTSPSKWAAARFVERRFKHGYKTLSRRLVMHPMYEVPATDFSVFLILEAWTGKREITAEAQAVITSILTRDTIAERNAERTAQYKDNQQPATNPFLSITSKFNPTSPKLLRYQQIAASNAIDSSSYALFMDPGTGKTPVAIAKIDKVSLDTFTSSNRAANILVLCPKNVRTNWVREIEHFSKCAYHCGILKGNGENVRNYALIGLLAPKDKYHAHIVVAGYEAAVGTELVEKVEWDLIILDESHLIASPSTQRTKFCLNLRKNSRNRMILTGTPIRNVPFDLYTQLEFLGEGVSGFQSFNSFKEFFGRWTNMPYKGIRILEEFVNIPLLQERLAKYSFIITKKEAMPYLPEKTYDVIECSLSHEQFKVYRQVSEYLMAVINSVEVQDAMTIKSHLTKLLRLAEITSGYAVLDEKGLYRFDPNNKLETLVEIVKEHLEENPNSKVLIWAYFNENIKQISYRFNEIEKISSVSFYGGTSDNDRIEAERRFNCDPSTRCFIGNPEAGGVGLNLLGFDPYHPERYETNADWSIYYSQNWSSVARRQSGDRNYRKGTRVPIRETDLIVPNSIDDMIVKRVRAKIDMALNIQDITNVLANYADVAVNGD